MRCHAQVAISLLLMLALGACGKTKDETGLVVMVWTDYSVPDQMDEIRVQLSGNGEPVTVPFELGTTEGAGKYRPPIELALMPGGTKDQLIEVAAIGFLNKTELVRQRARLRFIEGQAHQLDLYLGKDCELQLCGNSPSFTCDHGQCNRLIDVATPTLPPYDPRVKNPVQPDAALADAALADIDAAGIEVSREAGPRDTVGDRAEVNQSDVPALPLDAQNPDAVGDVPSGTGGTGGMEGTAGTGGGGTTGDTSQTGGNATGGTAGYGGVGGTTATGGTGGITSTIRTTASGGVDGGVDGPMDAPVSGGTIVVGGTSGGTSATGGNAGGTSSTAGTTVAGGTATGGTTNAGGTTATGGTTSTGGTGGVTGPSSGPCDIYAEAGVPCVAAYSMIRVLSKSYAGPLFQVRAGSSSTNNTMSGGTTKDIVAGPDGYVDSAKVDEACVGGTYCTVSVLYDHSGNENHLKRAPKGSTAGGATGGQDDYESCATKGKVTAGGHAVYSLYMNHYEGYRTSVGVKGKNMPTGYQPQGTYMLADGTRKGSACCWDFGNVITTPAVGWAFADTITLGHTWWGNSEDAGWYGFGVDFEAGVWAGGTKIGDPGYGALNNVGPVNTKNPSMGTAKFALGFIRVNQTTYAIRVADLATNPDLVEAYNGGIPEDKVMDHQGGITLGVGGDNTNNAPGTFYEGAIVSGFPTNEIEAAVMKNIKDVGYTR